MPIQSASTTSNRRTAFKLLGVIAASFAFGFALVPLYDVFCELTGLNGKTPGPGKVAAASAGGAIDDTRRVLTVEFTHTAMPGLPWAITPLTARLDVHPGELHQVSYRVHNLSDKPIVAQAVPSVSPMPVGFALGTGAAVPSAWHGARAPAGLRPPPHLSLPQRK